MTKSISARAAQRRLNSAFNSCGAAHWASEVERTRNDRQPGDGPSVYYELRLQAESTPAFQAAVEDWRAARAARRARRDEERAANEARKEAVQLARKAARAAQSVAWEHGDM